MKLYNFKRLINKYSVDFTLIQAGKGEFVAGKWEQAESESIPMRGAIVPMGEHKVYSSGGTYSNQDRVLYLTTPIKSPLSGLKIIHNGNTYTVEEGRDFESYADVSVYTLKWVSKK